MKKHALLLLIAGWFILPSAHAYRDSEHGTFLTRDPIGYQDGPNLYAYVHNNPITQFDPTGLKTVSDHEKDIEGYRQQMEKDLGSLNRDNYKSLSEYNRARNNISRSYNQKISLSQSSIENIKESAAYHNKTTSQWASLFSKAKGEKIDPSSAFVDANTLDDETALGKQVIRNHKNKQVNDALYTAYALVTLGGQATVKGSAQQAFKGGMDDVMRNSVDDIGNMAGEMGTWLGKDAKTITNKAGDKIFLSKDGSRRIRFDINRTTPHQNPHGHVEVLQNGKWIKSGPVYPKNVPKN